MNPDENNPPTGSLTDSERRFLSEYDWEGAGTEAFTGDYGMGPTPITPVQMAKVQRLLQDGAPLVHAERGPPPDLGRTIIVGRIVEAAVLKSGKMRVKARVMTRYYRGRRMDTGIAWMVDDPVILDNALILFYPAPV